MLAKKKVLFHSNYHGQLTGFGKNCKNVLSALFATGKYEIVELANGLPDNSPELAFSPWKCIGTTPTNPFTIHEFFSKFDRAQHDNAKKRIFYGDATIDKIIQDEKPDFYINVEDIWASAGYVDKPWWNKFPCMIWTTLDSLPLLPASVNIASKVSHYYIWSDFATKDLHKRGFKHVNTLHGALKTEDFFKLPESERISNRLEFGLDQEFVIGFVFRNQLRKSVPNFIDGLALFKKNNPKIKAKGLFVTNYEEGWDIRREILNKGLELSDILTPFVCDKCSNYTVKPCVELKIDCPICKASKSCHTVNIHKGLSESQLNEVYNLMDVYCHPFNSGGQEIPIQEAKLCELITLVTNYSCGTECCTEESGGLPLEWDTYYEIGSSFIKATTKPSSIAQQLERVAKMTDKERTAKGEISRKFVIENYSTESISAKLQNIINSAPRTTHWQTHSSITVNPDFVPDDSLSDELWLRSIYSNMLGESVADKDPNFKIALDSMTQGEERENVIFQYRAESLNRKDRVNELNKRFPFCKEERIAVVVNGERRDPKSGNILSSAAAFEALKFVAASDRFCCVFSDSSWHSMFDGQNAKTFDKTYELAINTFLTDNFCDVKTF